MTDQPPHICFLAPNAFPLLSGNEDIRIVGGAQLQQVIIARCLAARGYQVSMICLDFGQHDQITIDGIKVFRAFRPNAGLPIVRFVWPRLSSIWNCMKRVNADIYYQRAAAMYTGVMAGFCKLHGKKSIFAAAGNPDLDRNTTRLRYARDRWLYEYGLRNVDRIFVQNDEQSRLCVTNFGRVPNQIPNCYPAPTKQSSGADGHILWVSTIRKLKRPDIFLDLALALPNHRFRMIGGPSVLDANMYESIKAGANNLPNVDFLGFVPYSKIDDHFDEAAVFVNTSISEGFPNTFLQAWARGIPTVSFIDSGARLDGEPIGLRVDSLGEMVAKVKGLLSDSSRREQEGQRCAAYFKQHHSPERIVDLYEQVFQELLKNGPRIARRKRALGECVESGNSER